jgi:hypothetical protein
MTTLKPPRHLALATLALALALGACDRASAPADAAQASGDATPASSLKVSPWDLPVGQETTAAQPDLVDAGQGGLLLSWVEPQAQGHALRLSRLTHAAWSTPRTVAQGTDWFVNWADTPHVAATADGALWAHWLRKSAQATYAYDVVLSRSVDGGATWSQPQLVNTDGKPVEHGFVSLWPHDAQRVGVAWLDGRETLAQTATGHGAHEGHGAGSGAMTLRAAVFDATLQRTDEARLDAATCDCCQTDVAVTARGPLVLFRDRAEGEIRDIAAARLQHGQWNTPQLVHADGWKMPACPVNGPAVAAREATVLAGWYTAAGNVPMLKLARSGDAGDTFAAPVVVERGQALLGRVDVALSADAAWVLWLREEANGQSLQLARFAPDLSRELQRVEVARLQGRGRGTGFPQLAVRDGRAHVVWTDLVDKRARLLGATVVLAP